MFIILCPVDALSLLMSIRTHVPLALSVCVPTEEICNNISATLLRVKRTKREESFTTRAQDGG